MEVRWLVCKVLPGLFANERLVTIEAPAGGEIASILVDSTLVRALEAPRQGCAVPGRLRVHANRHGATATVMLPVASQEAGRFVSVPAELVAW